LAEGAGAATEGGAELAAEEMGVRVTEALGNLAHAERGFLEQHDGIGEALLDQPTPGRNAVAAMEDPAEIIEAETGGPGEVARLEEVVRGGIFEQRGDRLFLGGREEAGLARRPGGAKEMKGELDEPGANGVPLPLVFMSQFQEQGIDGFGRGRGVGQKIEGFARRQRAAVFPVRDGEAETPDEGRLVGAETEEGSGGDPATGAARTGQRVTRHFRAGRFAGKEVDEVFGQAAGTGVPFGRRPVASRHHAQVDGEAGPRQTEMLKPHGRGNATKAFSWHAKSPVQCILKPPG